MMRRDSGSFRRGVNIWLVAGWAILVVFGIGIIVVGIILSGEDRQLQTVQPSPTVTSAPPVLPTVVLVPTYTPLPTATPLPAATSVPPTAVLTATPSAMIEAGGGGVNVRSGPGTNFGEIGRLEPGERATVTGRYGDWWQIGYGGTSGWVANWVVTTYNTDSVAEVVPPPSPIPATAAPAPTKTPIPPTPAPAECRGVVADKFQVEGAPGPYSRGELGAEIRFHMWVTNKTSSDINYYSLGVVVDETGQYQNSYSYSHLDANKQFYHNDQIFIREPGTYHLWLTIGFTEADWCRLKGPVEVKVQ